MLDIHDLAKCKTSLGTYGPFKHAYLCQIIHTTFTHLSGCALHIFGLNKKTHTMIGSEQMQRWQLVQFGADSSSCQTRWSRAVLLIKELQMWWWEAEGVILFYQKPALIMDLKLRDQANSCVCWCEEILLDCGEAEVWGRRTRHRQPCALSCTCY